MTDPDAGRCFLASVLTFVSGVVVVLAGYAASWVISGREVGWLARTAVILLVMTAAFLVIFLLVPRSYLDEGSWPRRLLVHTGQLLVVLGIGVGFGYAFRDNVHGFILAVDGLFLLLLYHRILAHVLTDF